MHSFASSSAKSTNVSQLRSVPALLIALGVSALLPSSASAQEPVKAAHEKLEPGSETDDLGIILPIPASHPVRRYPASDAFPSGPEVGVRLPQFTLPNQDGKLVDFHADRGNAKAVVVFFRSAVW